MNNLQSIKQYFNTMRTDIYALIQWLFGYGDLTEGIKARERERKRLCYIPVKSRKVRIDIGKTRRKYKKIKQPLTEDEKKERKKRYNQTYQTKKYLLALQKMDASMN
jgi:hypothetical protein